MSAPRPITIIGGGLAGLTLGIALRQRDVPVTLSEAGGYPRHRVCGEFICGRGLEVLQELGLHEKLVAAGARQANDAAFFSFNKSYPKKLLPRPALCISRFVSDELLAREFQKLGGILRERERLPTEFPQPGMVRATGRRIDSSSSIIKWIGLKAHVTNAELIADLEMHFVKDGYVGLCRLSDGEINVCGLFKVQKTVLNLATRWQRFLRGPSGSQLNERLHEAVFDEDSFTAVSGLNLSPTSALASSDCAIGDALTMIPPVTGNGMSMAFESAHLAVEPLTAYAFAKSSWDSARLSVAKNCDRHFAGRLRWASLLQRLIMQRGSRVLMLTLANRSDWLWQLFFEKTR